MDDIIIIAIISVAGVASMLLLMCKSFLDQVPDVLDSASRARAAWERFKGRPGEGDEPDPTGESPTDGDDDYRAAA